MYGSSYDGELNYDGNTYYIHTENNKQTVSASVDGENLGVFEAGESEPHDFYTNSISMDRATKILTLTVTAKDGKTMKDYTITINCRCKRR